VSRDIADNIEAESFFFAPFNESPAREAVSLYTIPTQHPPSVAEQFEAILKLSDVLSEMKDRRLSHHLQALKSSVIVDRNIKLMEFEIELEKKSIELANKEKVKEMLVCFKDTVSCENINLMESELEVEAMNKKMRGLWTCGLCCC
jgi:hypothetical protein